MTRFAKIALAIAGLWFAVVCVCTVRQTPNTQLLGAVMTLALLLTVLIGFVRIFTHWSRESWRTVIPLVVCMLVVALYPAARTVIRRITFERSLPHFESIIRKIESDPFDDPSLVLPIAQAEDSSIYSAKATRSPDGELTVLLLTGNGFPVKHSGYLYSSSGVFKPSKDWPKVRELKPGWFRISD